MAICIHGWLDNSASFDALMAAMPQTSFIAVDLPGHGKSDHLPPGMVYHQVDWCWILDDILHALAIPDPILIGHSMGACAAVVYASLFPEEIKALVLVDLLATCVSSYDELIIRMRNTFVGRRRPHEPKVVSFSSIDEAVNARVRSSRIDNEAARTILSRNLICDQGKWLSNCDNRLRYYNPIPWSSTQWSEALQTLATPSLLISAADNNGFSRAMLRQCSEINRMINFVSLDGNHHIHIEKSAEVAQIITNFLESVMAHQVR